jgi:hypothetical protein
VIALLDTVFEGIKVSRSARKLAPTLVGACAITIALQCMAESAPSNVESLIIGDNWKEASRAIFLEAKSVNRFDWTIPTGQANAGFLEDALDTIAGKPPNTQSGALLALVIDVPSISPEMKAGLVQRALDAARKISGNSANYLKSGDLTKVALFYSRNGAESEARAVFEEALRAAESGVNEDGSGGYRQVTQAMVRESTGNRDWMIAIVRQCLQRTEKSTDSAFAYRDLAQVAVRIQKNELAIALIELGILSANTINQAPMQGLALESLANVAAEAGYTKRQPEKSPYAVALQEARLGNLQKAHAIVSGLSSTLYVDHGLVAYKNVFDDAVKRGDLTAALYFAENPVRKISWVESDVWRQVAELQVKNGVKTYAFSSYHWAELAISINTEKIGYFEEVKAAVALAESMRQNGFDAEGGKVILDALAKIDLIPERRADDRIKACTLLSEALWRSGMFAEAKQQILRAYRLANGYGGRADSERSSLLSGIGQATSTFIPQAGEVSNNNQKKSK